MRGAGLLASVELVSDKETRDPLEVPRQEIADRVRDEQSVIVRSIHQNVIIAPCLVLTPDEADQIVAALRAVLETTGTDGRPARTGSGGARLTMRSRSLPLSPSLEGRYRSPRT